MKKAIIFGAGVVGKLRYGNISGLHNIIGFADNAADETEYNGAPIFRPAALSQ
jgi:hypothetical protein